MTRPLRTLHLDTERTWRGGEQQALHLASGLTARGHVAEVAGIEGGEFVERARASGLVAHAGPLRGELNPRAIGFVRQLLESRRFDLLHAHTAHAHTIGAIAARLAGHVPCIVSRRVDFAIKRGFLGINAIKYRRGVTRYIAISRAVRSELQKIGVKDDKIALVPSGIDPRRHAHADRTVLAREFGVGDREIVVGAVGHFAWHKGFESLIDAAPALLARHADLRFVLLGDGELRGAFEERLRHKGVADRFVMPGFRNDVASFVERFDVFVAPSLLEGLNTSILDALALERSIVASNVGGIPEAIEHEVSGLLVRPGDVADLVAAIDRLLNDRVLAQRLAARGKQVAFERFTADAMVEGTLAVYADVLAASRSRTPSASERLV